MTPRRLPRFIRTGLCAFTVAAVALGAAPEARAIDLDDLVDSGTRVLERELLERQRRIEEADRRRDEQRAEGERRREKARRQAEERPSTPAAGTSSTAAAGATVLGMTLGPVPEGHPQRKGAYVTAVEGPAAEAGVVKGDIIRSVRWLGAVRYIDSPADVEAAIAESMKQRRDVVTLMTLRDSLAIPLYQLTAGTGPTAGSASRANEPFAVKGVRLGMTPEQITAGFERHGMFPDDGGVGRSFAGEERHEAGAGTARVSYTPAGAFDDGRPTQAVRISVSIETSGPEADQRIYADLVEQNGEPTRCTRRYFCTWTRELDGWEETLTFSPTRAANILLTAKITDGPSFRELAAATSAGPSPVPDSDTAPHEDFGPLMPLGIAIGMPMKEATLALEQRGFVGRARTGNACGFERKDGKRIASVRFTTSGPGGYNECEALGVLDVIAFRYYDPRGLQHPVEQIRAHFNERAGGEGDCRTSSDRHQCAWQPPPAIPLASKATLAIRPGRVEYQERAVPKLTARVEMPAAPVVPLEDQPWWKQELAKAEATGLSRDYAGTEQFKRLPDEDRQRLHGEVKTVYDHCEKRMTGSLYDCSCVAQEFVPERLKPIERVDNNCREGDTNCMAMEQTMNEARIRNRNSTHTVIKTAEKVMEQCADKARAANYAYESCKKTHGSELRKSNDLEAFCGCYGETFASKFVADPGDSWPALASHGTAAKLQCTEKGLPSPLNR